MRDWHREITDFLIDLGGMSSFKGDWKWAAARHFGLTPGWMATVASTDAFQDYYHRRTKDLKFPKYRDKWSSRNMKGCRPKSRTKL